MRPTSTTSTTSGSTSNTDSSTSSPPAINTSSSASISTSSTSTTRNYQKRLHSDDWLAWGPLIKEGATLRAYSMADHIGSSLGLQLGRMGHCMMTHYQGCPSR